MLEVAAVPALELRLQAWRFRAQFTGRARAAEEAAALLGTACEEAQRSEVLRTVLKVTLLAGEGRGSQEGRGWRGGWVRRLRVCRSSDQEANAHSVSTLCPPVRQQPTS